LLKINAHTLTNRITYLGRLEVRKGIIEFAKAIPMVLAKMPSASFRVIGAAALHPNDGQNIKNTLLSILGPAAQAVEFVDWVTYKEMPKYLSDTDICVFPSVWENFPYTCMEAMSAARAVVGSNSGGMAEIIDHNRTGFLIPAKQPKCIAAAIIELLLFPQKGIEMGLAAREHIKRSYAAEQISPLYEASYRRALVRAQVRNRGPLYWGRTHLDPAI
jgi:glycosyltransferase involved in cell wall biosynthesis